MTTIMLVRHGDTDWNVEEAPGAGADADLNETGLKQAELLAEHLEFVPIEAVYSSLLKPALSTAEAIALLHRLKVIECHELIDYDHGEWKGLAHHSESLTDVRKRGISLVNRIIEEHRGGVVLVSHHLVHRVLICGLMGLNNTFFWNVKMDNCAITTFVHENDSFVLKAHNDTSFLKPLEQTGTGEG